MSLRTPVKLRELQRKLYRKAKQEPTYRFYPLYDKVYRPDILAHAYALVKANGGAPGVDGQTSADIEEYGQRRFLADLGRELREGGPGESDPSEVRTFAATTVEGATDQTRLVGGGWPGTARGAMIGGLPCGTDSS